MASAYDDLVISASEANKSILQESDSAGTKDTSLNKGPKSSVTNPSLVIAKTIHQRSSYELN